MGWDVPSGIALTREQMEQRRLLAGRDLLAGTRQAEVARKYAVSEASASRWARTLREEGLEGLRRRKAPGAEPRLNGEQKARLMAILEEGPQARGWATALWTSKRVRDVIRREFGVAYHDGHVRRLLHQLGFRPRKPRRQAAEKDEAAKAEWLRTTWARLKKS